MNTLAKNFFTIIAMAGIVLVMACSSKDKPKHNINNSTVSGDVASGDTASSSSVSDDSVSSSSVSETAIMSGKEKNRLLAEIKKQRCANDDNIFEGDKDSGIYQYSLTGEEERYYDLGEYSIPEVISVDNDSILYFCDDEYNDEDDGGFFYAPLSGKKGNKRIEVSHIKKLNCGSDYENFIAKRKNTVYFIKNKQIHSLDLKTKKVRTLDMKGVFISDDGILPDHTGAPCIQNENAYFIGKDEYLYEFSLKNLRIKKISENTIQDDIYDTSSIAVDKENLYYFYEHSSEGTSNSSLAFALATDNSVADLVKISLKTGKRSVFLQGDAIEKLINDQNPWYYRNPSYGSVHAMVIHNGRIYFDIGLDHEGKTDYAESCHMMFSCPTKGRPDLTYERKFTECPGIKPYLIEEEVDDIWRVLNGTFAYTLGNGRFVIEAYDGNETYPKAGHKYFILYDINTNSAKRFEQDSLEYWLMIASGYTEFEEDHDID